MKSIAISLVLLLSSAAAFADVQLVVRDYRGNDTEISSNGRQARMQSAQVPGYALVDYERAEFLVIDPARNEAIRMRLDVDNAIDGSPGLEIMLDDQGPGAKIAGYSTRLYRIIANGQACGLVHASKQLLQNSQIRQLFESMRAMQRGVGGIASGLVAILPVCQRASLQVSDAMGSSGVPLKVVDSGGEVVSEVVSIRTGISIAQSAYSLPQGMNVVSAEEQMQQATQEMQQLQQLPEVEQMMQQLQQGGGATSEELQQQLQQQLQQLQETLQQLQQ